MYSKHLTDSVYKDLLRSEEPVEEHANSSSKDRYVAISVVHCFSPAVIFTFI